MGLKTNDVFLNWIRSSGSSFCLICLLQWITFSLLFKVTSRKVFKAHAVLRSRRYNESDPHARAIWNTLIAFRMGPIEKENKKNKKESQSVYHSRNGYAFRFESFALCHNKLNGYTSKQHFRTHCHKKFHRFNHLLFNNRWQLTREHVLSFQIGPSIFRTKRWKQKNKSFFLHGIHSSCGIADGVWLLLRLLVSSFSF